MEIPYTVEARPDTGLWNAKLGIWLFLASEVMLFGALFSTYILLRVNAPETGAIAWPRGSDYLNIPIGTFNTGVLIASSITVILGWASLVTKNLAKYKRYMGLTVLCGAIFLGVKSYEYHEKFIHYGITMADGSVVKGHLHGIFLKDGTELKSYNGRIQVKGGSIISRASIAKSKVSNLKASDSTDPELTLTGQEIDHIEILADGKQGELGIYQRLVEPVLVMLGKKHEGEVTTIQGSQVAYISNFGPWYSPFFAIYFTLTALHALHVFGGMIVNTYFWTVGTQMWNTQPQRFTNRVEVAGLFWHFVDLVWIFLFPVLYLL
jgi:cytochrome c oxidase subunit 3